MASFYWIKLYQEMLRDPKVGRLSDSAFRRFIELLLLAGEQDERDGSLPCFADVAWQLRVPQEQLKSDLAELEEAGIATMKGEYPFLVNFEKRQGAMEPAERMRRHRKRKQLQESYEPGNESVTKRNADRDRETDRETETETEITAAAVFSAYENNIGQLTRHLSDTIQEAMKTYPPQWILDAINVAVEREKRNWRYIVGILKNWQVEGRQANKPAGPATADPGREAWARVMECVRRGRWELPRDGPEAVTLSKVSADWHALSRASEKELGFISNKFIQAYVNGDHRNPDHERA